IPTKWPATPRAHPFAPLRQTKAQAIATRSRAGPRSSALLERSSHREIRERHDERLFVPTDLLKFRHLVSRAPGEDHPIASDRSTPVLVQILGHQSGDLLPVQQSSPLAYNRWRPFRAETCI